MGFLRSSVASLSLARLFSTFNRRDVQTVVRFARRARCALPFQYAFNKNLLTTGSTNSMILP